MMNGSPKAYTDDMQKPKLQHGDQGTLQRGDDALY